MCFWHRLLKNLGLPHHLLGHQDKPKQSEGHTRNALAKEYQKGAATYQANNGTPPEHFEG